MLLLSVLKKGYAVGRLSNSFSAPKFFKEQASLTTHGTSLCEDASSLENSSAGGDQGLIFLLRT